MSRPRKHLRKRKPRSSQTISKATTKQPRTRPLHQRRTTTMDNYEVLDDDATTLESEASTPADRGDFDLYDGSADTADDTIVEESVTAFEGSEQIDDPVRMYLMQMGEIPLLHPAGGDRRRQRDRADSHSLSPHDAGERLSAARCGHAVAKSPRWPAAARSHDRSLGDQHRGKEKHSQAPRPESRHARAPAAGRTASDFAVAISKSHPMPERRDRLATTDAPPQQGRAPGRGNEPAHRPPAAAVRQAEGNLRPHGLRSQTHFATARTTRSAAMRRAARRAAALHANYPRKRLHARRPHRAHRPTCNTTTTPPSASSRPATCGWSSRSPRNTATAA